MTTQVNQEVMDPPSMATPTFWMRDFARMNPHEFHGSKIEEDPQDFIDEVYKVVAIMRMPSKEKV